MNYIREKMMLPKPSIDNQLLYQVQKGDITLKMALRDNAAILQITLMNIKKVEMYDCWVDKQKLKGVYHRTCCDTPQQLMKEMKSVISQLTINEEMTLEFPMKVGSQSRPIRLTTIKREGVNRLQQQRKVGVRDDCGNQLESGQWKRAVWLDCSPGHPNSMLDILLATEHPRLDLKGISTCYGATKTENATIHTLNILHQIGRDDVPVFYGAQQPLCHKVQDRPLALRRKPYRYAQRTAITNNSFYQMWKKLDAEPESINFVITGPMTNLAILLKAFPQVKDKIRSITVIGGVIDGKHWSHEPHFNFKIDPSAAQVVLDSGIPMTIIPVDCTLKVKDNVQEFFTACAKNLKRFRVRMSALRDYFERDYKGADKVYDPVAHNPCAIYFVLYPNYFKTERAYLEIELEGKYKGRTNLSYKHHEINVTVCEEIEGLFEGFWPAINNCLNCVKMPRPEDED